MIEKNGIWIFNLASLLRIDVRGLWLNDEIGRFGHVQKEEDPVWVERIR
jgi:hypothetical protein